MPAAYLTAAVTVVAASRASSCCWTCLFDHQLSSCVFDYASVSLWCPHAIDRRPVPDRSLQHLKRTLGGRCSLPKFGSPSVFEQVVWRRPASPIDSCRPSPLSAHRCRHREAPPPWRFGRRMSRSLWLPGESTDITRAKDGERHQDDMPS